MANALVLKLQVLRILSPLLAELRIPEEKAVKALSGLLSPAKEQEPDEAVATNDAAFSFLSRALEAFQAFENRRPNYQDPEIRRLFQSFAARVMRADEGHSVEIYSHFSTPTEALDSLFEVETFEGQIFEPCCGEGRISRYLEARGFQVVSSDLRRLGEIYGTPGISLYSLSSLENVVTNPPDWEAVSVAEHLVKNSRGKVALLLRLGLSGALTRAGIPPDRTVLLGKRPSFYVGGNEWIRQSTRWEYAWFLWDPRG